MKGKSDSKVVSDETEKAPIALRRKPKTPTLVLAGYVVASILAAVANAVTFKKMLNTYKSHNPAHPHNYAFFVNEFNVFLYVCLASTIVLYKYLRPGGREWLQKQEFSAKQIFVMAALDSMGGFLSTIGGAYTGGAVQSLLNQCVIPLTLIMSRLVLNAVYTFPQQAGAYIILGGAFVAIAPTFGGHQAGGGLGGTTVAGALIYFSSVVPGAFSNVYKEHAFRTQTHTDIYFLTTVVSALQVAIGFTFAPMLSAPGFGGVPLGDIPAQFEMGFRCFLGYNSLPGDACTDEPSALLGYVVVNFLCNIAALLVTKHGSATLVVISAALALPMTNICFGLEFIMGRDVEPFSLYNVAALVIVVLGFLTYSLIGQPEEYVEQAGPLPIPAAAGSMMFMRERSNSDPSTPGYTPYSVRAQTVTPRLRSKPLGYQAVPTIIDSKRGTPSARDYGSVSIEIKQISGAGGQASETRGVYSQVSDFNGREEVLPRSF